MRTFFQHTLFKKISTWSLPARLLLFFTLFSLCTWSSIAALAWQWDARHARQLFDAQMILFAKTLAELDLSHLPEELDDFDDLEDIIPQKHKKKRFEEARKHLSFVVFNTEGKRLLSGDDNDNEFPFLTKKGFTRKHIDDDEWRLFMCPSQDGKYIIVVGQEREYRQEAVLQVLLRHVTPWFILLPLFLLGLAIILYQEFKPLRRLATQLRNRKAHDTALLDESSLTPETRPLIKSLNTLLKRIASLLEQERAFVSNAAHELRTPLAGLRIQAEVMELCQNDSEAREHALQKILQGSARCTHLVEQLLLLSRLEVSGNPQYAQDCQESVPWATLVECALEDAYDKARAKNIHIEYIPTQESALPQVQGFADLWAIALRNVLDNAVRYTPPEGKVRISWHRQSLHIENTVPHLNAAILAQLGQRFFRPPGQQEQGSGLGLAIVGHIATLHKAQVFIENSSLEGQQSIQIRIIFT